MSPRRRRSGGISTGKTERRKKRSSRNCLLGDRLAQVAVRGRHHPHVDGQRLHAPDALELPLLDEAQDLALERQRQVADLVEEERAVVGHLGLADLAPAGPGEGPLLVAEQLVLEQGLRDGRAVDGHERAPWPARESWWSARLISSLPVPLSPSSSTVASVAAARWMASMVSLSAGSSPSTRGQPEAPLVLLLEQHELGDQAAPFDRAVEEEQQVVGVDRLGEEVGGPLLHGPHRLLDGAEGGHHQHRRLGVGLAGRLQHVEAAARGQPEVGEDDQVAGGLEPPARLVGVARLFDGIAAATRASSAASCGATPCPRRSGCRPRRAPGAQSGPARSAAPPSEVLQALVRGTTACRAAASWASACAQLLAHRASSFAPLLPPAP